MQLYYDKGDIQLYLGDCIEILEKAAPESVDMIFADPPYMLSNGGISCQAGKVVCVKGGKSGVNGQSFSLSCAESRWRSMMKAGVQLQAWQ